MSTFYTCKPWTILNMRLSAISYTLIALTLVLFTIFLILSGPDTPIAIIPRDWTTGGKYVENSMRLLIKNPNMDTVKRSRTFPAYYPVNGTGVSLPIPDIFDSSVSDNFCKNNPGMFAVVPIYSAPGNFRERKAMRETLGKVCEPLNCKLIFILGITTNQTTEKLMLKEYYTERDIMMMAKLDTYRDLNNKATAMLDWLIQHCPQPKYVLHLIDDCYINPVYFLSEMEAIKDDTNYMFGYVLHNTIPPRSDTSRQFLSWEEYPFRLFPDYVLGNAYAFPNAVSKVLREAAHVAEYCWIEDVWITGHLRLEAGVKAYHSKYFMSQTVPYEDDNVTLAPIEKYLFVHDVKYYEFYSLYAQYVKLMEGGSEESDR